MAIEQSPVSPHMNGKSELFFLTDRNSGSNLDKIWQIEESLAGFTSCYESTETHGAISAGPCSYMINSNHWILIEDQYNTEKKSIDGSKS